MAKQIIYKYGTQATHFAVMITRIKGEATAAINIIKGKQQRRTVSVISYNWWQAVHHHPVSQLGQEK